MRSVPPRCYNSVKCAVTMYGGYTQTTQPRECLNGSLCIPEAGQAQTHLPLPSRNGKASTNSVIYARAKFLNVKTSIFKQKILTCFVEINT